MRDAIGWGEHDWEEPAFDGGAEKRCYTNPNAGRAGLACAPTLRRWKTSFVEKRHFIGKCCRQARVGCAG